jgi:hypothetical protein
MVSIKASITTGPSYSQYKVQYLAGFSPEQLGQLGAHAECALEELDLQQHEVFRDLFLPGHVGDAGQREHGTRAAGGRRQPGTRSASRLPITVSCPR